MVKRVISVFMVLFLSVAFVVSPSAESDNAVAGKDSNIALTESGYGLIAENGLLSLLFNQSTTEFCVINKETGYCFRSSLTDEESYEGEDRSFAYATKSLIIIDYYEIDSESEGYVSSYIDSVDYGNYSFEMIENGVRIEFGFDYPEITVPMTITLDNDNLSVLVLTDEMKYDSDEIVISSISVLPYFGAAEQDKDGFVLLPDGCGGLVYFDRERSEQTSYEKPVYGDDAALGLNESSDISLPVFGVSHGTDSFLAVISEDAEDSYICCQGFTQFTPYTCAYSKFKTASSVSFELVEQNNMIVYEEGAVKADGLRVDYYFLSGSDSGFTGMARKLKSVTFGDGKNNKSQEPALYLELYAAVKKVRSVWGLKFNYSCVLTSLSDADSIFTELSEKGVKNVVTSYNNFDKSDIGSQIIKKFRWYSSLGKDPVEWSEKWREKGVYIYFGYEDVQSYQKSWNPFHTLTTAARDTADSLIMYKKSVPSKSANVVTASSSDKESYLLNYKHLAENLEKLQKNITKKGIKQISFSDIVNMLHSDYRYGVKKRTDFQKIISDSLEAYKKNDAEILLKNPNYYAAEYADEIISLPVTSSEHDLIDADVPFLQFFYNGILRYSCEPVNLSANSKIILLKMLETGSMPLFSWIGRDVSLLKNTELEYIFSADSEDWMDIAVEYYNAVKNVYEQSGGTCLRDYIRLEENVCAIVYENGTAVVINYGDKNYALSDSTAVAPEEYCIVKEGQI